MPTSFFRLCAYAALAVCLISGEARAQVPEFDALYAFGDSLADNGNDLAATKLMGASPAVPPSESPNRTYFKGRFSNGYVAFEYLWQILSGNAPGSAQGMKAFLSQPFLPLAPSVNFAFGGTGTPFLDQTPGGDWLPGLKGQVELYKVAIRPRRQPRRPLFAIVTGANDYRADQFNVPMSVEEVVENTVDAIKSLHRDGARHFLVLNMPDLGLVPSAGGDPMATLVSMQHNQALKVALDDLSEELRGVHIAQADMFDAIDQVPASINRVIPALEALFAGDPTIPPGFPMSACLFIDPATCRNIPVPFNIDLGFLFWDIVHPTTEVHRFLAQYLYGVLQESYAH